MARAGFSLRQTQPEVIAVHHEDLSAALRAYYASQGLSSLQRFVGYTPNELASELKERLTELDITSSFMTLTALEAAFRIDYLLRCQRKLKDEVSRGFRTLFKAKAERAMLEDEILEIWKVRTAGSAAAALISELRAAFKYRHWVAHGRYWQPKLGRTYDFSTIYSLALATQTSFDLLTV